MIERRPLHYMQENLLVLVLFLLEILILSEQNALFCIRLIVWKVRHVSKIEKWMAWFSHLTRRLTSKCVLDRSWSPSCSFVEKCSSHSWQQNSVNLFPTGFYKKKYRLNYNKYAVKCCKNPLEIPISDKIRPSEWNQFILLVARRVWMTSDWSTQKRSKTLFDSLWQFWSQENPKFCIFFESALLQTSH